MVPFAETWMDLETVIRLKQSEREKQISYIINTYMWNLEKWYRLSYCNTEIETQMQRTSGCWRGKEKGGDELGDWG